MELSLWGLSLDNMAKLTTNSEKFFGEQQTPYGFLLEMFACLWAR
jgi:hypothetical protein